MSGEAGELSLKVLQLECIIDAKDREIQILREQLSQDQEEVIQQLHDDNTSLREQLANQTALGASTQETGSGALTADVKRAAAEAASVLQQNSAALMQLLQTLQRIEAAPVADEARLQPSAMPEGSATDRLLQLNVSGKHMVVPLSVLQQVPDSKLAAMFSAGSQQQLLLQDADGRYYLPFDPDAFAQIISVMQARSIFSSSSRYSYCLDPSLLQTAAATPAAAAAAAAAATDREADTPLPTWGYLEDLVNYLGLQCLLYEEDLGHAAAAAAAVANDGDDDDDGDDSTAALSPGHQQQQPQQPDGQRQGSPPLGSSRSSSGVATRDTHMPKEKEAAPVYGRSAAHSAAAAGSSKSADAAAVADYPGHAAATQALRFRSSETNDAAEPAAAAHAAAMQALLPKRSDSGSGAAAAAAVTSAALKGLTPHRRQGSR